MTQQGDPWGSSEYPQQGYGQNYPPGQPPQFQPYQQQYGQPGSGFTPPQQPYQQPYPPQYRPPRRRRPLRGIFGIGCGGLAGIFILIAVLASHSSSSSSAPPVTLPTIPTVAVSQAAAPAGTAAAAQTLTYVVTGSPAEVTYGPTGTNVSGTVPLSISGPLGSPLYYHITAQLQGAGAVTCKLEIDGKVISQASASGGYNIAMCEISRDPLTGAWQDTNG